MIKLEGFGNHYIIIQPYISTLNVTNLLPSNVSMMAYSSIRHPSKRKGHNTQSYKFCIISFSIRQLH